MQGIFIDGRRPKSKKEIKMRLIEPNGLTAIYIEATSMFGNEYGGPLAGAPNGAYHFVGPCPFSKRNFYGTITVAGDKVTVR